MNIASKITKNTYCFWPIFLVIILLFATHTHAVDGYVEVRLPDNLSSGLIHLLEIVEPAQRDAFTPDVVVDILEFMERKKNNDVLYHAGNEIGSPSAYHEFDIRQNLDYILQYTFNTDIPGTVITPSSIRLSHWKKVEGYGGELPRLADYLKGLKAPVIINGIEYIENTPDIFSGAYYSYDLYRTLILYKYQGRNVLISVSKQTDVSDVGKKGYVLGSDDNWDYFYSEKPGLNIAGLGWVRSYMYDSYGITVYYELDNKTPQVRCGTFRWIRAGWSKMNFVKNRHIYKGLIRFSESFKKIMEHPEMPDAQVLAKTFSQIRMLSEEELKKKTKVYLEILRNRYCGTPLLTNKSPSKLFDDNGDDGFKMNKAAMESVLGVEYIKYVMKKTDSNEIKELFHFVDLNPK